jgi:hypothetical protein
VDRLLAACQEMVCARVDADCGIPPVQSAIREVPGLWVDGELFDHAGNLRRKNCVSPTLN